MEVKKNSDIPRIHRAWITALLLLISTGGLYQSLARKMDRFSQEPIRLPLPLQSFPLQVRGWEGADIPIPKTIQEVAGNDDFLNRAYVQAEAQQSATVYVAYSARPRTMQGHRPQECYPANGWVRDETLHGEFFTQGGRRIPCLIHRFHLPAPRYDSLVVVNYYILNGRVTDDEQGFSGVSWRTPNINRDPARYVTQVQISALTETIARRAAADLTDLILDYFPDEAGRVASDKKREAGE